MHVSKFANTKRICNQNLRTLPLSFEFQSIDMVSWDGATILPLRMEYSNNWNCYESGELYIGHR